MNSPLGDLIRGLNPSLPPVGLMTYVVGEQSREVGFVALDIQGIGKPTFLMLFDASRLSWRGAGRDVFRRDALNGPLQELVTRMAGAPCQDLAATASVIAFAALTWPADFQ